jgi:hypothetical protein
MKYWIESSKAERDLAGKIAIFITNRISNEDELISAFIKFAYYFIHRKVDSEQLLTKHMIEEFSELSLLSINEPFAKKETDITTNFFSCLAFQIRAIHNNLPQKGVVATPSYLAYEMTKLATSTWVQENSQENILEILKVLDNPASANKNDLKRILTQIENTTWYDSSLGGGIFPLSILILMNTLSQKISLSYIKNIFASDIDRLYIEASKIRILLYCITHGLSNNIKEIEKTLNKQFLCTNSLTMHTEQISIDNIMHMPKVDIILGNPPYVKADNISENEKKLLKSLYPTVFAGKADLYIYFIANGINALRKNGILCFISPAAFQKSRYGLSLRKFVNENSRVRSVFDLDELPIFQNIKAHLSIYTIAKSDTERELIANTYNSLSDTNEPLFSTSPAIIPNTNIAESGWHTVTSSVDYFLSRITHNTKPLKQIHGYRIYSGIKSGHQKTYVINAETAKIFTSDPRTKKFIKPFLQPTDIRRWKSNTSENYMIVITSNDSIPEDSQLMAYLLKSKHILEKRSDLKGKIWYQLRDCSYYELFNKTKIIYPDISRENRFMIDTKGYVLNDGSFFIPQEDYFLLGLLNSDIALEYFKIKCGTIGNAQTKGRLRFKKVYVENFPVPLSTKENKHLIDQITIEASRLSKGIGDQENLNNLVNKLYIME